MKQVPMLENSVDRREFTLKSALALLSGVAITLSGCGGEDVGAAPTPPVGRPALISNNHGHAAVVTGAQLDAARDLVLDIRGQSDHPHTVAVSRADLAAIAAGRQVVKASSTDEFHNHTVTFN